MKSRIPSPALAREQGVALIIVLAFIVLLAGLVVAYFSRSITDRQLSNSSANAASADTLARSAADIIIGDLLQEIVNGSTATTVGAYSNYVPNSPANMLPARSGNPTGSPDPIPNLVRRSVRSDTIVSPGVGSRASAVNSTLDVSVLGRSISPARWNKHYLIPQANPGTPTDTTPAASFTAPDWTLVTNTNGPQVLTTPNTSVVGRYAYAIYDEGGLLDVNVAGYPSTSTAAQFGSKMSLAYANLTSLGSAGLTAGVVDNLVGWRNYASIQAPGSFGSFTASPATATNFFDFVSGNTSGFLRVNNVAWNNRTDQAFLSRQELINYSKSASWGASTRNLQYLTHFSRELNSPGWSPSTPTGSTIDYAAQKDAPASANRDLRNVRVTGSFSLPRPDGTTPQVGEPLIKARFPLSRLGGLGPSGIVATSNTTLLNGNLVPASAATIQRDFGLVWKTDHWDYCGPTGDTLQASIATIGSIGNREPNFFELLKAGMLSGSLGVNGGGNGGINKMPSLHEGDIDLQTLQIGANLIDQFDADSYPTAIGINRLGVPWEAVGIEHLPYLAQYKPIAGRSPDDPTKVATYFLVNLWNPHRATPVPPAANRPDVRLSIQGSLNLRIAKTGPDGDESPLLAQQSLPISTVQLTGAARDGYLNPGILTAADVGLSTPGAASGMEWVATPSGLGAFAAYRLRDCDPTFNYAPRPPSPYNRRSQVTFAVVYSPDILNRFQLALEYKTPSGVWRGYSYAHGVNDSSTWRGSHQAWVANGAPDTTNVPYTPRAFDADALDEGHQMVATDPRTRRFTSMQFGGGNFPGLFSGSLWPTNSAQGYGSNSSIQLAPSNIWPSGSSTFPALLSRNNSSSSQYQDADNVTRLGDSGYFTSGATGGNPFSVDADRPVILNRPFRSVAEMGYACRDMPFRSLDFFTDKSPDAGLLDLFAVSEATNSLRAGVFNLNTRQAPVLQAVLSGTTKDIASGATLSMSDAATVANTLATSTATNPLTNPAQLAGRIAAISTLGDRKVERETIARALAGSGQTRTWNLMIDVIAQTGRYAQSASQLKDFVVEGERRYWVHVAIDRFTGQVVDSQFEPVQE